MGAPGVILCVCLVVAGAETVPGIEATPLKAHRPAQVRPGPLVVRAWLLQLLLATSKPPAFLLGSAQQEPVVGRGALHLRGGAPPGVPAAQQSVPVFLMMPLDTISSTTGQVPVFTTSFVACVRDVMHHDVVARDDVRDGSRTCKRALCARWLAHAHVLRNTIRVT